MKRAGGPERRKGGAAGKFLRLGHRKQLDPPPSEGLGRVYPCISQAGAGWEYQASVTVRTHGRGTFSFPFGGLGLRIFFFLEEMRGRRQLLAWAVAGHTSPVPITPSSCTLAVGLTEALLEPDSSSALGGCVAFFRLRGLDRAAFLLLLGGLVEESSYSSAREKRSLNLRGTCFLRWSILLRPLTMFSAPNPVCFSTAGSCWP